MPLCRTGDARREPARAGPCIILPATLCTTAWSGRAPAQSTDTDVHMCTLRSAVLVFAGRAGRGLSALINVYGVADSRSRRAA